MKAYLPKATCSFVFLLALVVSSQSGCKSGGSSQVGSELTKPEVFMYGEKRKAEQ
jgi:hypothetical protein